MRLVIDRFKIKTPKEIEKSFKLVVCSDLHVGESPVNSGVLNLYSTLKGIQKIKNIDLIAVAGDLVNNAHSLRTPLAMKNLKTFLRTLGEQAPVVIVNGNHDIYMSGRRTREAFQKLGEIPNVTIVDNLQKRIGKNLVITGFSPRHGAYKLLKHGRSSHRIAFHDYKESGLKFNPKNFNIILTHSPHSLTNRLAVKELPEVYQTADLIVSGHLHNGLLFSGHVAWLNRYVNELMPTNILKKLLIKFSDWGFWVDPKTSFLINLCRGARLVGEGKIGRCILPGVKDYETISLAGENKNKLVQVVTKGVNKWVIGPGLLTRPSVVELVIEKS